MSDELPQDKGRYPTTGEPRETFEGHGFSDDRLQRVHTQLMREKEEPSEGFSPTPLFLVFVFMILAFWGGVYMVQYSGDFSAFHYDETRVAGVAEATGPREVDMMVLGRRVYAQNCQVCHQASGDGQRGVYPPVARADWVRDNPERLVKVVLHGLEGPVVVNGNNYNNAMTAFERLNDQQIAAVLTYIRTDPDFGNDSYPVGEELVARVRAEFEGRRNAWTQPELEDIHGPVTGEWSPPAADAEEQESDPAS